MPNIGTVSKPAYVYDAGSDTWIPVGVGVHTHSDAVQISNYFTAGKNKIINGDFAINQRAFSSTTTSNTYGFDRWSLSASDGTTTYSTQAFTLGTAPVAGYESKNFARLVSTGQTATSAASILVQPIESVRTFAGQTVTVSFWAKAGSGTPSVAAELVQYFGTGGSPSANVTGNIASPAKQAITTSWARYSFTIAVPSISGKTIGSDNNDYLRLNLWTSAGTDYNARTGSLGIQSATIDIWGVQIETGSVATPFTTATGTIQGELAACQRYYQRFDGAANAYPLSNFGNAWSTSAADMPLNFLVPMRVTPSAIETSNARITDSVTYYTGGTFTYGGGTNSMMLVRYTHGSAALTQYRLYQVVTTTSAGYLAVSAEL